MWGDFFVMFWGRTKGRKNNVLIVVERRDHLWIGRKALVSRKGIDKGITVP